MAHSGLHASKEQKKKEKKEERRKYLNQLAGKDHGN
jgi:hypothetical protein